MNDYRNINMNIKEDRIKQVKDANSALCFLEKERKIST